MMKTPIFDFVERYRREARARFHMPGHKGVSILGCEPLDITEIEGADVLYSADGVIDESERNATALFQTAHTFYSAEGSSLSIKAMLALVTEGRAAGERPRILAARNVHRAFVYACALLDLDVEWLLPEADTHLCSCPVTEAQVREALRAGKPLPHAVYLTSPDYLGQIADVRGIAAVCKEYGVPLLVDNAHGAYLRFLEPDTHPIALGASMCCDSAHKTLPVLTGGAYLHVAPDAKKDYVKHARRTLSLFSSTSPSYLILQSLDLCNRCLATDYAEALRTCIRRLETVKEEMAGAGFVCERTEPLKLVLNAARHGYTGVEMAEHLRRYGIEPEFADAEYLVLMATPQNMPDDFERLSEAFGVISPREAIKQTAHCKASAPRTAVCTVREAMLAEWERVAAEQSVGRICASPTVSCPPAVPVVICGERITEADAELFARYGVREIDVVIEQTGTTTRASQNFFGKL